MVSRSRRSGQASRPTPMTAATSHCPPAAEAGVSTATPPGREPWGATESEGRTSESSSVRKASARPPGCRSAHTSARLNRAVTVSRSRSATSARSGSAPPDTPRAAERHCSAQPEACQISHRSSSASMRAGGSSAPIPQTARAADAMRAAPSRRPAWSARGPSASSSASAAAASREATTASRFSSGCVSAGRSSRRRRRRRRRSSMLRPTRGLVSRSRALDRSGGASALPSRPASAARAVARIALAAGSARSSTAGAVAARGTPRRRSSRATAWARTAERTTTAIASQGVERWTCSPRSIRATWAAS